MQPQHPVKRKTRLLAAGSVALRTLGAALVLSSTVSAHAQELPSTPLQWQFPLPVAPRPTYPIGTVHETAGSFLEGRFLLGVNVAHSLTPDQALGSHWSLSPVVRNTPRRLGWGPSFGLSGYTGNIVVPIDGRQTTIGEMKIRPLMGGISYSIGGGRLRTSFSLVGGYAFTSAKVTTALPAGTAATIDVTDAWVVRPNVGVTYALMKRLALIGSVGYVYTNPTITIFVSQPGQPLGRLSGTFRSDYVSITAGTAVSIF
jgi:hypothetical protein